jgi:hypothetical protein
MNRELQLRLQAHLDGELAPAQLREITELLAHNQGSQGFIHGITSHRDLIRGNEVALKLTESRNFIGLKSPGN